MKVGYNADTGTVGILNVGAGDIKLSFDKKNPAERIRAARIVKDMLRRGFALLIEVAGADGKKVFTRATDFDENTCEYIIADFDPSAQQTGEQHGEQEQGQASAEVAAAVGQEAAAKPRGKAGRKRVDAAETRSVAVARTAGG